MEKQNRKHNAKTDVSGNEALRVAVSFADCFAFAEYFKNTFEFYDCNANGRIYNYIDFSRRGRLLTMQEIFDEWKAKETDR